MMDRRAFNGTVAGGLLAGQLGGEAHSLVRKRRSDEAAIRSLSTPPSPAYAPDLNPVELLWGNLKGHELANLCPADLTALRPPIRAGCRRIRRQPPLAFAFLRHAGMEL